MTEQKATSHDHGAQEADRNGGFTEAEIQRAIREDPGQAQCETVNESRERAIGWLRRKKS